LTWFGGKFWFIFGLFGGLLVWIFFPWFRGKFWFVFGLFGHSIRIFP
jgi:hypothetical protein